MALLIKTISLATKWEIAKLERDKILMLKLTKLLWELQVPTEHIKSLFQDDLNKESFEKNI